MVTQLVVPMLKNLALMPTPIANQGANRVLDLSQAAWGRPLRSDPATLVRGRRR